MKGSPAHQVKNLYLKSGIDAIGTSKHAAKAAARENIAAGTGGNNSRSATWHQIGKQLGVHSYATQNAYRDVWRHVLQYSRENFGIRDAEKLTPESVSAYLQSKIDAGVKHATFMQYAAAAEKLETALNMYSQKYTRGKEYHFSNAIKPVRSIAHEKLERFTDNRAYLNPKKIIETIKNETYKIVAKLQYQTGLRIKETNMITKSQLLENNQLLVEGGKGGKIRTVQLSPDLYFRLQTAISSGRGKMSFNKDSYRRQLATATKLAGENPAGKSTHGLRWSYAQTKFQSLQRGRNLTYTAAEQQVSSELGHDRADTTQHYIGH